MERSTKQIHFRRKHVLQRKTRILYMVYRAATCVEENTDLC